MMLQLTTGMPYLLAGAVLSVLLGYYEYVDA